jgi:hypothetical protein
MNDFEKDCSEFFGYNTESAELAVLSIKHISDVYPIYIMLHYHGGEVLSKEQLKYFDLLKGLIKDHNLDITLVVNEQDVQNIREYDTDNLFKYLVHSCYDSKDELSNNISKIKNYILKSAASRFGNKNISWVFLIEEDVKFFRRITLKYVECKTPDDWFKVLCIWQYIATKRAYSEIEDENNIGLSGITTLKDEPNFYGISKFRNEYEDFVIYYSAKDQYLCSKALLINLSECNRKHIEFDLMNDVLEDADFNINMFANGLHVVTLASPLAIDFGTRKEYRSNKKLSNMALNLWAKWGDKVVQNLVVENNQIKAKFATDFSKIIEEFNSSNKHRMNWPKNERLLKEYMNQKKRMHQSDVS